MKGGIVFKIGHQVRFGRLKIGHHSKLTFLEAKKEVASSKRERRNFGPIFWGQKSNETSTVCLVKNRQMSIKVPQK